MSTKDTGARHGRPIPLLLALVGWALVSHARADPPLTDPAAPDSMRVVSLNVAGISKPEGDPVYWFDEAGQMQVDTLRAAEVRQAFRAQLALQADESDDRSEALVLATTEATDVLNGVPCSYFGSPYASVAEGLSVLGEGYDSYLQSWDCADLGMAGNDFTTNAAVADYAERYRLPSECHPLGAHAIKVRFGPGEADWMWVVNTHLSHNPDRSVGAFVEILDWVEALAGPDWDRLPILIVGDFNLVADGYDAIAGDDWEKRVCVSSSNPDGLVVTSDWHREASATFEDLLAENGFEHLVDRRLPTFKAWQPRTRVDYAVMRNRPAGGWTHGYRLHPVQEMNGVPAYWTDHMGLTVVVRHPAPDQIWLVTQ